MGGLWGSFDSSIGGVVGQTEPGATYNFDNVTINCMECIPFNQLIGGDQYGVKGLPAVDGVTVNYPAKYTCSLCGNEHCE